MQKETIRTFDVRELLSVDDHYIIPVYQRNYAWGAKEIEQLIQDVIDYSISYKDKNYYIGTLVVAVDQEGKQNYQTIDGQQRLTTLCILSAAIKNEFPEVGLEWYDDLNISYASRTRSTMTMRAVYEGVFNEEDYEANIRSAYDICVKELKKKTKEHKIPVNEFAAYLYQYVKVLRVPLPEGIDLNHYFEIMNSRGEQLEKHEILKAKLMECFGSYVDKERREYEICFDLLWEACSNMERYVQTGFAVGQRDLLFGANKWDTITVYTFEEIVDKLRPTLGDIANSNMSSIDEIIQARVINAKPEDSDESPDRFNSVINFQNFLLHVLRVQIARDEVALDDKRLLQLFEKVTPKNDQERIKFVKAFIYNLLKCKFLFDKYVIKREFTAGTDRWSLKALRWHNSGQKNGMKYTNTFGDEQNDSFDSDNRKVLMLLSMFHVSIPSQSYKYWLNAALNYLFDQFDVDARHYIEYLEHIAKAFVFDRYLAKGQKDYYEMIFKNLSPIKRDIGQLDLEKLRFQSLENNLVFNFLDYLIWPIYKDADNRVRTYEYTFRSSVEHYYPQTPMSEDIAKMDEVYLHSFGNLCLISHEKNSRLSNHSAAAKRDYYGQSATLDSLKQYLMMRSAHWGVRQIDSHNTEMIDLFSKNLNSGFQHDREVSLAMRWFKEFQIRDRALLIRALLCFGDCVKHTSGDKYNLFNFEFIKTHSAFKGFESYVSSRSPENLIEIIDSQTFDEQFEFDYRYFFIKYPEVIGYCKEGNFQWFENTEGNLIYLLEGEKNTRNKSRELYIHLLQQYLLREFMIDQPCDYEGFYIKIAYSDGVYSITGDRSEASLQLVIWNDAGDSIHHHVETYANGNSKAVRQLEEHKWQKNSEGYYERFGMSKLLDLGENYRENVLEIFATVIKLLKNGFGIKLF